MNPTRGVCSTFVFAGGTDIYTSVFIVSKLVSLWPNWIRRLTTNQKIGGSSPSRDTFLFFASCGKLCGTLVLRRGIYFAWMPEGSKGADLRSAGRLSAWVRTPLQAYVFCFWKSGMRNSAVRCAQQDFFMPPWPNG